MLDAGGGGGYAGETNWFEHNVDSMWSKLANQQTDTHWQHVSGWQKTSELSSIHLSRLMQYREGLIEAWPPEKNEAARAYVARLDLLIKTVQGVYDVAVANHQTFKGVTQALWESRRNLEEIYNEYQTKKQAKEQYDAALLANKGRPPRGMPQPTTQDDLEILNNRARSVMFELSGELATAQLQIRQPPPYNKNKTIDDPSEGGGSSAMGTSGPPVLTPVVPMSPGGGSVSYTSSPTPAIHTVVSTPPPAGAGPVLGTTGTLTPPAITPTPPSVIPPTPPPTAGPGLPPPLPPGLPPGPKPPGIPPGSSYPSTVPPGGGGAPKSGLGPGGGLTPRAMPPGGMIGGTPGAGLAQPTAGTGAARRINPVGGVIGGGGAGTAPIGGAGQRPSPGMGRTPIGAGQAIGMGSGTRGGGRNQDEQNTQHWDPDNPWETDEGVAPVMMPSRESGRIDPGPAIGRNR